MMAHAQTIVPMPNFVGNGRDSSAPHPAGAWKDWPPRALSSPRSASANGRTGGRGPLLTRAGSGNLVTAALTGAQVSAWKRRGWDDEGISGAHWRPAWLIRLSDLRCSKCVPAFRLLDSHSTQMSDER